MVVHADTRPIIYGSCIQIIVVPSGIDCSFCTEAAKVYGGILWKAQQMSSAAVAAVTTAARGVWEFVLRRNKIQ